MSSVSRATNKVEDVISRVGGGGGDSPHVNAGYTIFSMKLLYITQLHCV